MERSAEELLIFIFDEILPKHGMALRIKQKELSLEMLQALQEDKLRPPPRPPLPCRKR